MSLQLHNLSEELLLQICSFCTSTDLLSLGTVSKSFKKIANDNSLWQRHLNQLWCQHSSHPLLIQYRNIAVQLNNTLNFLCLNNEPSIPSFTTLYKITYKVAYFKLLKVIRCCKESADFLTIAMPDVEIVKTLIQFYKEKQFFVVCFQTHLKEIPFIEAATVHTFHSLTSLVPFSQPTMISAHSNTNTNLTNQNESLKKSQKGRKHSNKIENSSNLNGGQSNKYFFPITYKPYSLQRSFLQQFVGRNVKVKDLSEAMQLAQTIVQFIASVHLRGSLGEIVLEHSVKETEFPLKYRLLVEMLQNLNVMLYFYFFFDFERYANKDDYSYLKDIQMTQKPLPSLPFSKVLRPRHCVSTNPNNQHTNTVNSSLTSPINNTNNDNNNTNTNNNQ